MSFDYAALKAEVPDVLIPRFGIPVTLQRASRAPAKSWEQDQGPAASSAAQSIATSGVQVALDKDTIEASTQEQRLGRWALTAEPALPEEVGPEWELVVDGLTYPISAVRPVKPGPVILLYFVVVQL